MMNPKISIIIPVYNVEEYIKKCLDSVRQQTFENFECILIDDGSTDHCGVICDSYAEMDDRFSVFHQKNAGVSVARNYGISVANGEYIVFADPDDYLANDYFENAVKHIMNYDMVIYNATYLIDSHEITVYKNKTEELSYNEEKVKDIRKYVLNRDMPNINIPFMGTPWMKVYRKQIILDCNLKFIEGIHPMEDVIFNACYVQKCNYIRFINRSFYYYRIHKESSTFGVKKNRYENFELVQRALLDVFQDNEEMLDPIYFWSVSQLWYCLSRQTFNKRCFPKYRDRRLDFLKHTNDTHVISTLKYVENKNIPFKRRVMIILYKKKCIWGLNLMCIVFDIYKRLQLKYVFFQK